jgi:uncharacterized protein (DUF1501 family)
MRMTRRSFFKNGVTAFTLGFAAPRFLTDLAQAQGMPSRSLVVLYLGGGNDALSFLVPYTDGSYYSRRPTQAVAASSVLQVGADSSGAVLGLHPSLGGVKSMFDAGQVAIIQRTGYENASRSHFRGTDILSTADPGAPQGIGWLGRYLDTLPSPVDPLVAWNTVGQLPRTLQAATVGVPSIPDPATYAFASPGGDTEADYSKAAVLEISSHLPSTNPNLAFVNSTTQAALATVDRVALVADYTPTVDYPDSGLGQALRAVAGAMVTQVGTQVFWVQTGGYDTHAGQDTTTGYYSGLLSTLDQAVLAFRNDLTSHGLFDSTMVLQFSEFGRRVSENGSRGTDHGAAGLMLALGGGVSGGLYGTAASLADTPDNPTLENDGRDVKHQIDFRSVYARVIDDWLGANSIALLGSDFRSSNVDFV